MAAAWTLTIVVPALNEAAGVESAVAVMQAAARQGVADYEILLYDDGSTDATGRLMDALAAGDPRMTVIHHAVPQGLGGVVRAGYARARMDYVLWVDGKGATTREALDALIARGGAADLVVPFPENDHERPWFRRVLSGAFVQLLNELFGFRLRYYNMPVLCPATLARAVLPGTRSHAFQAEMLIRLMKAGARVETLGVRDNFQFDWRHTTAFRWSNLAGVAAFLWRTWRAVHDPAQQAAVREAVRAWQGRGRG